MHFATRRQAKDEVSMASVLQSPEVHSTLGYRSPDGLEKKRSPIKKGSPHNRQLRGTLNAGKFNRDKLRAECKSIFGKA